MTDSMTLDLGEISLSIEPIHYSVLHCEIVVVYQN